MVRKYTTIAAFLAGKAVADGILYIGCYPTVTETVTVTGYTSPATLVGSSSSGGAVKTVTLTQTEKLATTIYLTMPGHTLSSLSTSTAYHTSGSVGQFTNTTCSSEATDCGGVLVPTTGSSEAITTTTIKTTKYVTSTVPFPTTTGTKNTTPPLNTNGTRSSSALSTLIQTSSTAWENTTETSTKITPTKTLTGSHATATSTGFANALYFTNWGIYAANYQPQQIPGDKVTHLLYAFANIQTDGTVFSSDTYADLEKHYTNDSWNDSGNNAYGCVRQLYIQKKKNRQMKLLLSIGGWTYSPRFGPAVATAAGRQTFCSSALALVKDWGFDGIDIDWEYPTTTQETQYYVDLVQECRSQFDAYAKQYADNYHFLITIAAPAGPINIAHLDLPAMDQYVDAWHLMAYDYAGSWDTTSGHQSNVHLSQTNPNSTKFSTDAALDLYLAQNIDPRKIVLGLPLYGHSFANTTGPGKPYTGLGAGSIEQGIWLYKDLPRSGASEYYDDSTIATWSYDNQTQEMVTYDNIQSAKAKTQYLLDQKLGGAVYWEASGDRNDSSSIVATVAEGMGDLDSSMNLLSYPASVYDNIRNNLE